MGPADQLLVNGALTNGPDHGRVSGFAGPAGSSHSRRGVARNRPADDKEVPFGMIMPNN